MTKPKKKKDRKEGKRKDSGPSSKEMDIATPADEISGSSGQSGPSGSGQEPDIAVNSDVWRENHQQTVEEKSRDDEFEEFLEDLFL